MLHELFIPALVGHNKKAYIMQLTVQEIPTHKEHLLLWQPKLLPQSFSTVVEARQQLVPGREGWWGGERKYFEMVKASVAEEQVSMSS